MTSFEERSDRGFAGASLLWDRDSGLPLIYYEISHVKSEFSITAVEIDVFRPLLMDLDLEV